ncbi:MAG: Nicotinamide mononucleotide transporter PnuC [Candidatus Saccharibacteria bacterium]|nr:Nicotinamide mononucleotide transporter PnuC [Candidatus Saccharibacteria bacterium]
MSTITLTQTPAPVTVRKPLIGRVSALNESIIIGVLLTGISYLVGIGFGWLSAAALNWLEVFAVFTSYSSTWLCVKEKRINYPIGAVSSAAYAVLFLQSGLLSSAVLNAYLVPTLIYGWLRWRKDSNTRPVTRVSLKMIPVYALIAGLGYAGAALLSQHSGGAMAWTDSVILAGTILAQFLLDNKKLENWIIWAVVNVFAIYTYATTGLPLVAFQYVFFLANTVYGYIEWNRSRNNG